MRVQSKIYSLFVLLFLCISTTNGQFPDYTKDGQSLQLNKSQKIAALWFDHLFVNLDADYLTNISALPFNWDGDSLIMTKEQLVLYINKVHQRAMIIDTIINSADSMKKYFLKSPQKKYKIVEIRFYQPNDLRATIVYVGVLPKRKQVSGFYWIGWKNNRALPKTN